MALILKLCKVLFL